MKPMRLRTIDIAKAICILLVVLGHYSPANSPAWYKTLTGVIYSFHMPLFMYLSGYLYRATRKPLKYGDFVMKKTKRLLIPYFLISVLIISIKILTERYMYVENPVSWRDFISIFYLPSAGYFLWFIYTLFLIFLIIPFFRKDYLLNTLFAASLIAQLAPFSLTDAFCIEQFRIHLFYFVLGCITFRYQAIRRRLLRLPPAAAIISAAVVFAVLYYYQPAFSGIFASLVSLALALTACYSVILISRLISEHTKKISRQLLRLSAYTYTIYLFHTIFEGFAKALLLKLPFAAGFGFLLSAAIVITAGVAGPVILGKGYAALRKRL